jgi:hypothetical protein
MPAIKTADKIINSLVFIVGLDSFFYFLVQG